MPETWLVGFLSIHHLNRLKRRLQEREVYLATLRTPHFLAERGCGFSLECPAAHLPLVRELAANLGIEIGTASMD